MIQLHIQFINISLQKSSLTKILPLNPPIRPPRLTLLITNNRQIHPNNILLNSLRIRPIGPIIRPQTLLHTASLTLTQPPLGNPLPHNLRLHLDEPPLINQRSAGLQIRFSVREHVDSFSKITTSASACTFSPFGICSNLLSSSTPGQLNSCPGSQFA
jgi:hypothetical protein